MARLPTSGATSVTLHRTESELGKVLRELCPEAESVHPGCRTTFFVAARMSSQSQRARRLQPNRHLESSMAELVPMGYLSRREAVDVIVRSLFAGTPDQPHVIRLRRRTESRLTKPMPSSGGASTRERWKSLLLARTFSFSAWKDV